MIAWMASYSYWFTPVSVILVVAIPFAFFKLNRTRHVWMPRLAQTVESALARVPWKVLDTHFVNVGIVVGAILVTCFAVSTISR